jgi:hypothetical protein
MRQGGVDALGQAQAARRVRCAGDRPGEAEGDKFERGAAGGYRARCLGFVRPTLIRTCTASCAGAERSLAPRPQRRSGLPISSFSEVVQDSSDLGRGGAGDCAAQGPHVVAHTFDHSWPIVGAVLSRIWESVALCAVACKDPRAVRLRGRRLCLCRRRGCPAALHHPMSHPAPPAARGTAMHPARPPGTAHAAHHWPPGHDQLSRHRRLRRTPMVRYSGRRACGKQGHGGHCGETRTSRYLCHDKYLGGRRDRKRLILMLRGPDVFLVVG